jgi:hypothetical protein
MITLQSQLESLSPTELLAATRELVCKTHVIEADLLVHLGEVDERKLFVTLAHPSMFDFCVSNLGFSEDAAYNRIAVARAARRFPAILESIRSGQVHLFGMRLLSAHFTEKNHRDLLARAAGKSKREIEELIASIAPRPPVPATIRKVPERPVPPNGSAFVTGRSVFDTWAFPPNASRVAGIAVAPSNDAAAADPHAPPGNAGDGGHGAIDATPPDQNGARPQDSSMPRDQGTAVPINAAVSPIDAPRSGTLPPQHRSVVEPLSGEAFRIQFTATRSVRDKLRQAQDLLRHRVPDGDLSAVFERALDALIEKVKKERFAVGVKPRTSASTRKFPVKPHNTSRRKADKGSSPRRLRYIPASIRRAVYERDGGRCTFTDPSGHRCKVTDAVEYDHVKGFARTKVHRVEDIRLRCRAHNQYGAREMYGREFVDGKVAARSSRSRTSAVSHQVSIHDHPPKKTRPRRRSRRGAPEG